LSARNHPDPRDLYGLPFDRFVAERAALARAFRSAGEPERAVQVAKLRKPSLAAWAVNQLVRTQRRAVAELFEAGDRLQRTQYELLGGRGSAGDLRAAVEGERRAVERLTNTARGLLSSEGQELSAAILERVRATLHAAALDPAARAQVRDGCLERELRHVGIGGTPSVDARPRGPSSSGRRRSPKQAERERAEREQAELLKARRMAAAEARRAAERAARELKAAQERRDRAAAALEEADVALAAARRRAEQAERERERTR
jgi:hypothetical protein